MAENRFCNMMTLFNGHGQLESNTNRNREAKVPQRVSVEDRDYKRYLSLMLSPVLY